MELGSGLAAFGFWMMVAVAVVAGMWFPARMAKVIQDAELAKMRLAIESGQSAEQALDKLQRREMPPEVKLRVVGSVMLGIGAGTAVMGWFIGQMSPGWTMPLYGCGALTACIGLGLWLASAVVGGGQKGRD